MDLFTDQAFFRSFHSLFGIAWIGLLYYFNFVQTEYVKVADPDAKSDVRKKLAPNALWWFRWAAFFTFLTGLILFYQITARIGTEILLGATMGTFMMLNVWGIIWRNQKIVLGMKEGDVAVAAAKAGLASRTNTLFSIPMLLFMGAASHYPLVVPEETNYIVLFCVLAIIIGLIEVNAIIGKPGPMASVKGVIHSGVILSVILFGAITILV